ncbi:MAG: sensor histidine kinase [Bacteroidetes bacterium]|nr:sensor histidine kinase [Bacteroidota bacterium]
MKKILFLIFIASSVFGQNQRYIDSVKALTKSKVDTVRFSAYSELVWVLKETNKTEALEYGNNLLTEATKTAKQKWIAQGYNDLGIIYIRSGDLNKALFNIEKSLAIREKLGDKKDIASSLSKIANIKTEDGKYGEALEMQLRVLRLYEELNIQPYIAHTCNNIGQLYNNINKYSLSNTYLMRAYTIEKEIGDVYGMPITLAVIGSNYSDLQQPDSAIKYLGKAKTLFKEVEDYTSYAIACNNLGHMYRKLKDTKKGKENYEEALSVSKQIGDSSGIALFANNLANILIDDSEFIEAENILLNSLDISKKLGLGENILKIYQSLTGLYIQTKDAVKADFYFDKYRQQKDSIFSSETALQFSEAQTKFDVEKKDLELAKNKAEIETKEKQAFVKNIIIISIIVLSILLGITGFLFYRKKQIEQQAKLDSEIAHQKEIRTKAILEAEEKERRRIAQDLHDGVGQLLSAAKLNLSNLDSKIATQTEEQKLAMQNALSLVDDSVKEVRAVSHNMMPNTLIKLGLASAVREFITKLGNAPTLKVDLEIVGLDTRLDNQIETVLYRVIQEIVNNIIKHAKASQISMQLIRHDTELNIMIEDNGVGFDTNQLDNFEGIGLKGIQTRIEFLNGSVHFDSSIGRGTTVIIDIPLI